MNSNISYVLYHKKCKESANVGYRLKSELGLTKKALNRV